jgi:hypothetical protein
MKNSVTAVKPEAPKLAEPDVSTIPQPQRTRWILFGIIGAVAVLTILLGTVLALWVFSSDDRPNTFGQYAVNLLIGNKSVQEELKVSAEQMEKVTKLEEDRRKNMPARNNRGVSPTEQRIKTYQQSRAMEQGLTKILDKEQMTRLRQITLQIRVKREPDLVKILFEEEIAPALNLTQQQKDELQSLEKQFGMAQGGRGQGGRGQGAQGGRGQGGRGQGGQAGQAANMDDAQKEAAQKAAEEQRQKAEETRKAQSEQILAVLSPDQQSTWQGILGTPFTGEISNPQAGRAGGRRGNGGQN